MSDASCRLLTTLFDIAAEHGVSREELLRGTGVDVAYATDVRNWLSWHEINAVEARAAKLVGGYEQLRERAVEVVFTTSSNRALMAITRTLSGPKMVYRAMAGWVSKQLFAVNEWEFVEYGERDCEMRIRFSGGFDASPGFLHLVAATLEGIPTVVGYRRAEVSWDVLERGRLIVYTLRVPESRSLFARIMRFLRAPFASWAMMKELEQQSMQLEMRQHEIRRATVETSVASNLRTAFLATVSPDLRRAVAGVSETAQRMLDEPMPADQTELVRANLESGERLDGLLAKLLDFVSSEHRAPIEFDPTSVVQEVVADARMDAAMHGTVVSLELPRGTDVRGDGVRWGQVLAAMLDNALVHGEAANVSVSLTRDGDHWSLEVRDDGAGMEPEELQHLFEPLVQSGSGLVRRDNTIGLSIAIARRVVHAMGGEIRCRSTPGVGTVFTVTVPLPEASLVPA